MARVAPSVREDSYKFISDLSFQVTTNPASFAASNTGYWFLQNQGTDAVYIAGGNTVTSSNFKLDYGASVQIPFIVGQSESLRMFSVAATQTVAGFLFKYDTEI
jgi:hypothetical protein